MLNSGSPDNQHRIKGKLVSDSRRSRALDIVAAVLVAALAGATLAHAQKSGENRMTFFVTSAGPGKGADLGGLSGADQHCQKLAKAAGSDLKEWRAYLSTSASGQAKAINARDRIGSGPWHNTAGDVIGRDVEHLHGANNGINRLTAIDENGRRIPGRGDSVNKHDILTGSTAEGRAFPADKDMTCSNWTSSGSGAAMVGHHDRMGLSESAEAKSWNASHPSRGCGQEDLRGTGGDGLFYCFAVTYR